MNKKRLLKIISYAAHGIYGIGEQLQNEYRNEIRLREIKRAKRKKYIFSICIVMALIVLLVLVFNGGAWW